MSTDWILEQTRSPRFPVRIRIEQDGEILLAVRAQSAWPGPGQQIFCVREHDHDPDEELRPVEQVRVAHLSRVGRKLAVVLDRPQRKRCEFLVVHKPRAGGDGNYEQIFFRTESGIRAHRSRTRLELRDAPQGLTIAIDAGEKYPWRFPGATTVRRKLAVGDYALLRDDRVAAVVERKSFDNLLGDMNAIQAMHHHWADLARMEQSAVVIEAQYGDFLNPGRLAGRWPEQYVARILAELAAMHPRLPMIYAGNRKHANLWTERYFAAAASVAAGADDPQLDLITTALATFDSVEQASLDDRIRHAALHSLGERFATAELADHFAGVEVTRFRRILLGLEREGRLTRSGTGRGVRWTPRS
ncbi:MAG: hypothetical protein SFU57_11860 [Gemmatimonadales bacterium]|nr:hypothetical protein [Gemmatimonadales bacterium]